MKEIPMREFDYITGPAKLLTPEVVHRGLPVAVIKTLTM